MNQMNKILQALLLAFSFLYGCSNNDEEMLIYQARKIDSLNLENGYNTKLIDSLNQALLEFKTKENEINKKKKPQSLKGVTSPKKAISAIKHYMSMYHPDTEYLKESIRTVKKSNGTVDVIIDVVISTYEFYGRDDDLSAKLEYIESDKYNSELGKQIRSESAVFNVTTFGKNEYRINSQHGLLF